MLSMDFIKSNRAEVERYAELGVTVTIFDTHFKHADLAGVLGELEDIAAKLYRESDLILAQEFVYTLFDWRIGMLNRKPIYACQYFMIKEHWQIMKHDPSGKSDAGRFKTLPVAEVPAAVINAATAAATASSRA